MIASGCQLKAAFFDGPGQISVREITRPVCPSDSMLVRVTHTGICGSDLLMYTGERDAPAHPPGHEFTGIIEEVGNRVDPIWEAGTRIVTEAYASCGNCRWCLAQAQQLCEQRVFVPRGGPSGLSEIAVVHQSSAHVVPAALSPDIAPLAEPLAVALHALKRGLVDGNSKVLVIGSGTIGLCTIMAANALGVKDTTLVAKYKHQADLASNQGSCRIINPDDQPPSAVDVVINTATGTQAMEAAIAACRPRGRIVLLGGFSQRESYALRPVVSKEIQLLGSICYDHHTFATALEWLATGRVKASDLITHRFGLDRVQEAFETALQKNTGAVKVMVEVSQI